MSTKFDDYLQEQLKDPEFRKEYEALFYYKESGVFKECPVIDRSKTPKEFQTDEWWIKRGL